LDEREAAMRQALSVSELNLREKLRLLAETEERIVDNQRTLDVLVPAASAGTRAYNDTMSAVTVVEDHLEVLRLDEEHRQAALRLDEERIPLLEQTVQSLQDQLTTLKKQVADAETRFAADVATYEEYWNSRVGCVLISKHLRSMFNCVYNPPGGDDTTMLAFTFSILSRITESEITLPSGVSATVCTLASNTIGTGQSTDHDAERHTMDLSGVAKSLSSQSPTYCGDPKVRVLVFEPSRLHGSSSTRKTVEALKTSSGVASLPTSLCGPSDAARRILEPQHFFDNNGKETRYTKIPKGDASVKLAWGKVTAPTDLYSLVEVNHKRPATHIFDSYEKGGINAKVASACLARGLYLLVSKDQVACTRIYTCIYVCVCTCIQIHTYICTYSRTPGSPAPACPCISLLVSRLSSAYSYLARHWVCLILRSPASKQQ